MKNVKIEVEGSELVLKNSSGDYVIIPKNKRNLVKRLMKEECYGCIDSVVDKLPVMSAYAEDGSIITEDDIKKKKDNIRTKLKVAVPIKKDQPIKDVSNIDEIFKQEESDRKTKQDVIDKKRERFNYENPKLVKGVSSGNKKLDFLYNNQWLFDVPIVKDLIKNKAKDIAGKSRGQATVGDEIIRSNDFEADYTGNRAGEEINSDKEEQANLLDQFFSEKPLLKESEYKPTSDYLEFLPSYSVKPKSFENKMNTNEKSKEGFSDALKEVFFGSNDKGDDEREDLFSSKGGFKDQKKYKDFVKDKKTVFLRINDGGNLAKLLNVDLGGHKVGVAWDEEKKLPYMSISDAWDFESKHYSKKWGDQFSKEHSDKTFIQASLLQRAGNPFKIYDRFYFDINTGEYIPDEKTKK
jgi:hypothetical protein